MKQRFNLKNFYSTALSSEIPIWSATDTVEHSFTVVDTVSQWPLYIIVDWTDSVNRDVIYIHRVSGNTFYYYHYNRTQPNVIHNSWTKLEVNDLAQYFNYTFKNLDDFWEIKKNVWLSIEVRWWTITVNWTTVNISDTNFTVNDNTTNYIVLDYVDNTIKVLTDTSTLTWIVLWEVVASWWDITTITDKRSKWLQPVFDPNDFAFVDWKIRLKTWWVNKVKADDSDTSSWYLSDKVDNTTLEVDTTAHKMKVKDWIYASSSHTHTSTDITDFDTAVSNNSDVSDNKAARHTHSNKAVLDNITDSWDGSKYLADDWSYKTVSGTWDVVWPSSSTDAAITLFDWTTGKTIKDSSITITTSLWNDDTTVPTSKAVSDAISDAWWWDMLKSVYDTDDNWIVDDSEKLWWKLPADYEQVANKVSAFQTTTDDTHYPTEKLVKDNLDTKADKVTSAVDWNLAWLDTNWNLVDSWNKPADFASVSHTHALNDLSDVDTTTLSDWQALVYDESNSEWKPWTVSTASWNDVDTRKYMWMTAWTKWWPTSTVIPTHTHTKSDITDFTESDYVHTAWDETISWIKTFNSSPQLATLTQDDAQAQVLVRDDTTNEIKRRDVTTIWSWWQNTYDAIVAADWSWDYTTLYDAINDGKKNIFVKSWTYNEALNSKFIDYFIKITWENRDNTIISFAADSSSWYYLYMDGWWHVKDLTINLIWWDYNCSYIFSWSPDALVENIYYKYDLTNSTNNQWTWWRCRNYNCIFKVIWWLWWSYYMEINEDWIYESCTLFSTQIAINWILINTGMNRWSDDWWYLWLKTSSKMFNCDFYTFDYYNKKLKPWTDNYIQNLQNTSLYKICIPDSYKLYLSWRVVWNYILQITDTDFNWDITTYDSDMQVTWNYIYTDNNSFTIKDSSVSFTWNYLSTDKFNINWNNCAVVWNRLAWTTTDNWSWNVIANNT